MKPKLLDFVWRRRYLPTKARHWSSRSAKVKHLTSFQVNPLNGLEPLQYLNACACFGVEVLFKNHPQFYLLFRVLLFYMIWYHDLSVSPISVISYAYCNRLQLI